jgi:hypothetical protein
MRLSKPNAMTNDALMAELDTWAREDARMWPDVSTCQSYGVCNRQGILNGKHCMMSYVGRDYGAPGISPRLALVGMDHRDQGRGDFADRRSEIEHFYQNRGCRFDPHYVGVVKTAAAVFGSSALRCQEACLKERSCQKSRDSTQPCVIDRIAQPNVVKCVSDLTTNGTCKASTTMWANCTNHLIAELKILRPELVVFHGANAKWSVKNAIGNLEPVEIEQISGAPVLYRCRQQGVTCCSCTIRRVRSSLGNGPPWSCRPLTI